MGAKAVKDSRNGQNGWEMVNRKMSGLIKLESKWLEGEVPVGSSDGPEAQKGWNWRHLASS